MDVVSLSVGPSCGLVFVGGAGPRDITGVAIGSFDAIRSAISLIVQMCYLELRYGRMSAHTTNLFLFLS